MDKKVKKLVHNSIIYNISGLIPIFVNILLVPIYTRILTPADYGIISIAEIITRIITVVLLMGVPSAIVRFYYDFRDRPNTLKSYLGAIISFMMLVGLGVTISLVLWGRPLFNFIFQDANQLFNPYIILAICTAFLLSILPLVVNLYRVLQQAIPVLIINLTHFVLASGLIIYFVVVQREGALGSLKASLIASLIMFIVLLPFLLKQIKINLTKKYILPSLRFGLPLVPHALALWLLVFFDRILIKYYLTLSDVGIYSLGYSASMIMSVIVIAIQKAWEPFFLDRMSNNQDPILFAKLSTYYAFLIITIGLLGSMFSQELINLITGPDYRTAASVVPPIILAYIFHGFYLMSVTLLFYKKMTSRLPIFTLIAALVNIGLNLLLIPTLGIVGAAYATTVGYLVLFMITFIVAKRAYVIPYEYGKLLTIFATAIVIYLSGSMLVLSPAMLIMTKVGMLLAYIVILLYLRVITTDDIKKIPLLFKTTR